MRDRRTGITGCGENLQRTTGGSIGGMKSGITSCILHRKKLESWVAPRLRQEMDQFFQATTSPGNVRLLTAGLEFCSIGILAPCPKVGGKLCRIE